MRIENGIAIYEQDASGLITSGKFLAAVPSDANVFAPGCILIGCDGKVYTNAGSSASPSFQDINNIQSSEIGSGAVTKAKLASGILASHIVKFIKLGSEITTDALVGVAVGDLVISILADGTVTVAVVATVDTLPADPADTTYLIVLRATA